MNFWIEDIEKTAEVEIKVLRYRHDVEHILNDAILNSDEREKLLGYKSKKRQLEFYFTRVLWETFISDQKIEYKATGKPILNNGFISITHSHDCIAIAYSFSKELGLDIEPISRKIEVVKRKFSHPRENFDNLLDLTKAWCIKEAVYKLMDMDDVFFMDDIYVATILDPIEAFVEIESIEIKPIVKILELPNDMIMAYAIHH